MVIWFERVFYGILMACGIYVCLLSRGYSSRTYPIVLGAIIALGSLVMIVRSFLKKTPASNTKKDKLTTADWNVIKTIAITFLYVLSLRYVGFVIASAVFIVVIMWMLGYRKPLTAVLIAVPFSLAIYFFFTKAIHVSLPSGILPF